MMVGVAKVSRGFSMPPIGKEGGAISTSSVAYTHLDVYKRQSLGGVLNSRPSKMTGIRIDNASEYFIL